MSHTSLSEKKSEISETLFDIDAKLINAEEWLLQLDYAAKSSENEEQKSLLEKRRDDVLQIQKDILPDIEDVRFSLGENGIPKLEYLTPYGGWVRIHQLSLGYSTMVAWIIDVAARMFEQYPKYSSPLEQPVIILVDEIDLHLHPKWQRQIFDFLEARFPKAQFIVTAHSPLIVQSAPKDANIIVLRKEKIGEAHVVKIDNDKNYVRNWRVDQILSSDLFDNVGIRNEDIEKEMQERTELLQKDNLSDQEQVRLNELNNLSYSLPTADNPADIEAMDILRRAAVYFKNNNPGNDQNQ